MRSVLLCLFYLLASSGFAAPQPVPAGRPYSVYIPDEVPIEKQHLAYFLDGGRYEITAEKNAGRR